MNGGQPNILRDMRWCGGGEHAGAEAVGGSVAVAVRFFGVERCGGLNAR